MNQDDKVLLVRVVEYWGRVTVIPECERSRLFAELLGQKTLTSENIAGIKKIGFKFKTEEKEL